MVSTVDEYKKRLNKKFKTLLGTYGISRENELGMLRSYGVDSSSKLDCDELLHIIKRLEMAHNSEYKDLDLLRKRVIAVIGAFLRATHREESISLIKGIACRAASDRNGDVTYDDFNKIPRSRLSAIYGFFVRYNKSFGNCRMVTAEEIGELAMLN